MKPRLRTQGVIANPRDSYGYRCGLRRLALGTNASISFVQVFTGQRTSAMDGYRQHPERVQALVEDDRVHRDLDQGQWRLAP